MGGLRILHIMVVLSGFVRTSGDEVLPQDKKNTIVTGCLPPTRIDNNEVYLGEYPFGFNLTVVCVNSTIIGSPVITCMENGQWNPAESYCEDTSCSNPAIPKNGFIIPPTKSLATSLQPSPSTVTKITYACKEGYQIIGHSERQCVEPNGTYEGELPKCAKTCGAVYVPLNGSVHTECLYTNCTAIFMCHEGYKLEGEQIATCLENGSWSHQHLPLCLKIYCGAPPVIESTEIVIHGQPLAYPAIESLTKESNNTTNNSNNTSNSTESHMSQILLKSEPVQLYPYGSQVTYNCLYNFTLFGNQTLRCSRNGNWSGQLPYCVVTSAVPVNTRAVTPPPTPSTETLTKKSSEQTMTQTMHSTKTAVATQSPTTAKHVLKCKKPRTVINGRFYFHGKITVLYKCDYGFTLIGIHERTCLENGTWNNEAPRCAPIGFQDFAAQWRTVFLKQREWAGTYVYYQQPTSFRLWVMENKQPGTDHLEMLFDDEEAKLYMTVTYINGMLRFSKTRLLTTKTKRFLPGHDWAFDGYLHKNNSLWHFSANSFQSDPGFEKLEMKPKLVYEPPPPISEPDVNGVALALGVIIACLSFIFASALAAVYVRSTAKKEGHRSVTSFDNPVYDCQHGGATGVQASLRDQDQYEDPSEC